MQPTIKDLRQAGYKVRVLHTRQNWIKARATGHSIELNARGGSTTIEVTTPDGKHNVVGKSVCSMEDNFNRKLGNSIALGRALQQLEQY
jgi:hypothetical protein